MELMLAEYSPWGEMKKLEQELWSLKMKGSDSTENTERFSNLALLCPGMVTTESKKVERFIRGLTPQTQGNVMAANPLAFNSAKRLVQTLIYHGDHQDPVPTTHEPPKESGGKKKF